MSEECKPFFDKNVTLIIKGICILMMFIHHFFTFPSWWLNSGYPFCKIWSGLADLFNKPAQICVPIFCFITGYFYYYNKKRNMLYSFIKILKLLIPYWLVFFCFALLAVLLANYQYSQIDFFAEMFALRRPTMVFCWYVYFYIFSMIILPVASKILDSVKNRYIVCIIAFIIVPLGFSLINKIIPFLETMIMYFPTILSGYVFAKYDWFCRITNFLQNIIQTKVKKNLLEQENSKIKSSAFDGGGYCLLL